VNQVAAAKRRVCRQARWDECKKLLWEVSYCATHKRKPVCKHLKDCRNRQSFFLRYRDFRFLNPRFTTFYVSYYMLHVTTNDHKGPSCTLGANGG